MEEKWLIWDGKGRSRWWKAPGDGDTPLIEEAYRYDAEGIAKMRAMYGGKIVAVRAPECEGPAPVVVDLFDIRAELAKALAGAIGAMKRHNVFDPALDAAEGALARHRSGK